VDNRRRIVDNLAQLVDEQNRAADATERNRTHSDERRFDTAGRLDGTRPLKRTSPAESPPAGLPEEFIFRGYGMDPPGSPVERPGPPDRSTPGLEDVDDLDAIMAAIELSAAAMRIYVDELRARIALARHR